VSNIMEAISRANKGGGAPSFAQANQALAGRGGSSKYPGLNQGEKPAMGTQDPRFLGALGKLGGRLFGFLGDQVGALTGATQQKAAADASKQQIELAKQQADMQKKQFELQDFPFRGDALRALQKRFQMGASPTLMQERPSYFNARSNVSQAVPGANQPTTQGPQQGMGTMPPTGQGKAMSPPANPSRFPGVRSRQEGAMGVIPPNLVQALQKAR